VWRNVIFTMKENVTCAWFFSLEIDHAILRFNSLILFYMHMYCRFLAIRFSSFCIETNCNMQCPQLADDSNLFYLPSAEDLTHMEIEIQAFQNFFQNRDRNNNEAI